MIRIKQEFGGHSDDFSRYAMTKNEITASLCHAGTRARYWVIPEFDIPGIGRIDVVWAERNREKDALKSGALWRPVAAFEVEGSDVWDSLEKDSQKLAVAHGRGAKVLAVVLYQVGDGRDGWDGHAPEGCVQKAQNRMGPTIEVTLDQDLPSRILEWVGKCDGRSDGASR